MITKRAIRTAVSVAVLAGFGVATYWWHRPPPPDQQLQAGRSALAIGDASAAGRIADELAAADHSDHARLLRAEVYLRQGNPAVALAQLNLVRDRGDLRREAAALSGQCLLQLGNLREAERAFHFVLCEQPDHADGHRGLAAVYYDQGALLKCLDHLAEVARLDPADGRPSRMMGVIHADLDRRAEAVECYREALRRTLPGPMAAEAREELAEQLVKLGEHAAALDVLGPPGRAAESPHGVAVRAEAEWGLGRPAEAAVRLDAALKDRAQAVPLLRLRGRLHVEAGEWDRAAAALERAVQADPSDLIGLHQLAGTYDRLERPVDAARVRRQHGQVKDDLSALTTLNREADARPWDPAVRVKLAAVCDRLGKVQLAGMWRRSAAACGPRPAGGPN